MHGGGQLFVGGDAPNASIDGYTLPELGVNGIIHFGAQIVKIGREIEPGPGHGIGYVAVCPGKSNVIFLVVIDQGVQLGGVIIPADFVVFHGKSVSFQEDPVEFPVDKGQIFVRLADGVVDQADGPLWRGGGILGMGRAACAASAQQGG